MGVGGWIGIKVGVLCFSIPTQPAEKAQAKLDSLKVAIKFITNKLLHISLSIPICRSQRVRVYVYVYWIMAVRMILKDITSKTSCLQSPSADLETNTEAARRGESTLTGKTAQEHR